MTNIYKQRDHRDQHSVTKANDTALVATNRGIDIPAENVARIFDPFFTTKEVGKGTGLGLSICYGIIEEHGGDIKVTSKLNEGSTITIELPLSSGTCSIVAPGSGIVMNDGARRRVLVVDDEPAIVELLTDILTMDGHGVDVAKNGRLALKKLSNASYDNVITDMKMPEMDGRELHRRIREIDPNLAANVVFMTGDTTSVDIKDYLDKSGNVYLVKPFNLHELRETLHKVMKTIEN